MRFAFLVMLTAVLFCSGCTTPMRVEAPSTLSEQHKFVKSYSLGQQKTVNVGDSMVKVEDYWIENLGSQFASPTKNVILKVGLVGLSTVNLDADKRYRIKGTINVNGIECLVLAIKEDGYEGILSAGLLSAWCALVAPDGSLVNRHAMWTLMSGRERTMVSPYDLTISDPSVRIVRESTPVVKTTKGYENYELLYTGVSATGLNLTYREFSPDGLARVAFFQSLTYEAGAKSITFKKFRIAVEKATSESITFTVLSDGYDVKKD